MTTPTREELAAMIDPYWDDDLYRLKRVADVVLPLLAEKDARIAELEAGCPLGDDPLEGANCHLCGRAADTFWVSDDLWQRVGLDGQVCFRCFRVAAWHVNIRPESNWLVALDAERDAEIERLRIEVSKEPDHSVGYTLRMVAERDAAHAEVERLRAFISSGALGVQVAERIDKLVAERDVAHAEIERLRAVEMDDLARHRMDELKAWRADADRLAALLERFATGDTADPWRPPLSVRDALVAHDRLKADET